MGVALRFVRRSDGGEAITPAELESIVKRLRGSTVPLLVLSAATIWFGLQLHH
jgi:hypothetical protein